MSLEKPKPDLEAGLAVDADYIPGLGKMYVTFVDMMPNWFAARGSYETAKRLHRLC